MSLDVIILKKLMIQTSAEIDGVFSSLLVLVFMIAISNLYNIEINSKLAFLLLVC